MRLLLKSKAIPFIFLILKVGTVSSENCSLMDVHFPNGFANPKSVYPA